MWSQKNPTQFIADITYSILTDIEKKKTWIGIFKSIM